MVNELGAATVNLKARYWFDSGTYAPDKINSALMRISKTVLLENGIELPDPAREVVFPRGVPIQQIEKAQRGCRKKATFSPMAEDAKDVTASEGDLSNECPELEAGAVVPEAVENLLKS